MESRIILTNLRSMDGFKPGNVIMYGIMAKSILAC